MDKIGHRMDQLSAFQAQRSKEADRRMDEFLASQLAFQKEADQRAKEAAQRSKEAAQRSKEADRRMDRLDRQIQKIGGRFNERWGRLIEALVEGKMLELLQARGINVEQICPNSQVCKRNKDGSVQSKEFDLIAVNGKEVVATEVKTVLTIKTVDDFIEVAKDFKAYFPYLKDKIWYAAVAGLKMEDEAATYAEKQGLFVIRAVGDSARLINKKSFKPKVFA